MPSWEELSLFVEPNEAIHVVLWDDPADGWSVRAIARRRGAGWNPDDAELYCELTAGEAYDVVSNELYRLLELGPSGASSDAG